ncbi:hypothetical protein [Paraclostridium sordellii]|uniref:hypothetical protein n=1 Tax=Paraclostridium sordellii TaxID=1505 RepID=UPI0022E68AEA|nr:hypothetical protein [Paeniclostridium sordellii]
MPIVLAKDVILLKLECKSKLSSAPNIPGKTISTRKIPTIGNRISFHFDVILMLST